MSPLIQATYADGYIHSEKHLNDVSPYSEGHNVFYDILNGLPEAEHGKMIEFTLFYNDRRYSIDWTTVPEGAQPVRYKKMRRERTVEQDPLDKTMANVTETISIDAVGFGYQWTDKTVEPWENKQVVREL